LPYHILFANLGLKVLKHALNAYPREALFEPADWEKLKGIRSFVFPLLLATPTHNHQVELELERKALEWKYKRYPLVQVDEGTC
jgi:hypothetical protein